MFFRTACVIAVAKARDIFEPFLHQVSLLFLVSFLAESFGKWVV